MLYAFPLALLIASPFLPFETVHDVANTVCIYLLIKWVTDYRKCTASYLECKIRGVSKEEGFINGYVEPIINLNRKPYIVLLYAFVIVIIIGNLIGKFQVHT